MVEEKVVIEKLKELNKYLKQLRKYEGVSKNDLAEDIDKLWTVERGLQLSIQIILDIGSHILAEKGIMIEKYSDVFIELAKLDIIPEDFSDKIKGMAGFRNVLVHEYADVDVDVVTKVLNNSLDDFEQFAKYINDYLKK
ncbi:MAG: type VII toxin-antitoxin system HepT family RNase toxin [Bacillota bacterium]